MSSIPSQKIQSKTGKWITIRTGERKDHQTILNYNRIVMGEGLYTLTQPDELPFSDISKEDWIQKMFDHPDHLLIVAEYEGIVVGNIDFTNGHRRWIAHTGDFGMAIDPSYREDGLGTMLLGALIEWATAHPKIEKVNLKAHSTNTRALNLYKKFNFIQEGLLIKDMKCGPNQYVDTVIMGRFVK